MKKVLSLFLIVSLSLSAQEIDFNQAKPIKERKKPSETNAILSYSEIIKNATSSIVHIATTHTIKRNHHMQDFFEEFFGKQFPQNRQQHRSTGLGSGVIISSNGYIVTNNHVIDQADEIIVTLADTKKEYKAKLIGSDKKTDIAVIKIETENKMSPILMGDSSNLEVGDIVFAIGNPFGVGQSVTQGIISAQHKNGIGINEYENFIQTDASINPGNSGGALIDSRGALIGINSAILSKSGGNNGIGFAIEVNMVKNIVQKLVNKGKITRGYMGVQISDLYGNLDKLYTNTEGALLIDVNDNTPAEKAGLKRGDLILKINNKKMKSASQLKNFIGMLEPGVNIHVEYERDKKIYTTTIKLENQETLQNEKEELLSGLILIPLNDNIRYQYRIPHIIQGVLVKDVQQDSEAQRQGIQKGDIIVQIENYKIDSIETLRKTIKKYKGQYKRVYINRNGQIYMVAYK
ncbi:Do family serine endopeptidase [Campylobacterota bacterium]